ncbi:M48 family metalloprotease [Halorussus litoreus]|uniref:M48 family metalloprotease n=1 Tax=Halorussus litoreus TaxID=1710536 RepID=UPI000E243F0E|nr:M48 family metalloprotease [Halorussus litoreus]
MSRTSDILSPTASLDSGTDSDLPRRVAVTLALVLAADAAFVAVFAFLARPWLARLLGDPAGFGASGSGDPTGALGLLGWLAVLALGTAALAWAQLRYVHRESLAVADARPVSESEYPDLHARLERLAKIADVPAPAVAVAETEVPNSFAVGGIGGEATIVVSRGLLDALADDELDAVLAHELAHLRNRDAAVMTLATFLPALANDDYSVFDGVATPGARKFGLAVLALVGYAVSTALVPAPAFSVASLLAFAGFVAFTVLFGGAALGVLAIPAIVLAGRLSHLREFAADRAGALVAGDPGAMASALETLDGEVSERPTEDVRASGIRELCLLPHGIADRGSDAKKGEREDPLAGLPLDVETHPPTDERVARLRDLAAEGRDAYR